MRKPEERTGRIRNFSKSEEEFAFCPIQIVMSTT